MSAGMRERELDKGKKQRCCCGLHVECGVKKHEDIGLCIAPYLCSWDGRSPHESEGVNAVSLSPARYREDVQAQNGLIRSRQSRDHGFGGSGVLCL